MTTVEENEIIEKQKSIDKFYHSLKFIEKKKLERTLKPIDYNDYYNTLNYNCNQIIAFKRKAAIKNILDKKDISFYDFCENSICFFYCCLDIFYDFIIFPLVAIMLTPIMFMGWFCDKMKIDWKFDRIGIKWKK